MSEFDVKEVIEEHDGKCKTRAGYEATQVTLFEGASTDLPIRAVVGGFIRSYRLDGSHRAGMRESDFDLIMPRSVKSEVWCALYSSWVGGHYSSLEDAKDFSDSDVTGYLRLTEFTDGTWEREIVEVGDE